MQRNLKELEQNLGYQFRNQGLMVQALTHPSALHERSISVPGDYQRLEFLGDAVLGMLLAEILCERFPGWNEGMLSRLRARLAGQDLLADRARKLDVGPFMLLGRGEEQSAGRHKDSILADVLEALLAAVYLDAGLEPAREIVMTLFDELLKSPLAISLGHDAKSELQEFLSASGQAQPEYHLISESGPPHDRLFHFKVMIDGEDAGEGRGKSKKIAQQAAAAQALERLCGARVGEG